MHVAGYLKKFMFDPKYMEDKVLTLSGGEANRLLLAKALTMPGNFLILDEPTNDLDMDTLEMLLEILADYSGTLIVVSHDRDFLERLVTRSLIFTGDKIIDLYGGYNDYLKYYKKEEVPQKIIKEKVSTNKTTTNTAPQKLSYKYARLLESLPSEINQLEKIIFDIEQQLSNNDLYTSNNNKYNQLIAMLENANKQLDEKMLQWLEVENMADSIKK